MGGGCRESTDVAQVDAGIGQRLVMDLRDGSDAIGDLDDHIACLMSCAGAAGEQSRIAAVTLEAHVVDSTIAIEIREKVFVVERAAGGVCTAAGNMVCRTQRVPARLPVAHAEGTVAVGRTATDAGVAAGGDRADRHGHRR